jgi:hypothetical protein
MARIKIDKSDLLAACDSLEENCFLHLREIFRFGIDEELDGECQSEKVFRSISSPDGGHHVHRLNEINTCSSAAWKFSFFFVFIASRNVC